MFPVTHLDVAIASSALLKYICLGGRRGNFPERESRTVFTIKSCANLSCTFSKLWKFFEMCAILQNAQTLYLELSVCSNNFIAINYMTMTTSLLTVHLHQRTSSFFLGKLAQEHVYVLNNMLIFSNTYHCIWVVCNFNIFYSAWCRFK